MNQILSTRSRTVLAISAWLLLAAIAVGYVTLIEEVDSAIRASYFATALFQVFLYVVAAAAIAAWVAGVVHASVQSSRVTIIPKWLLVTLLVLFNFVGAMGYYFLYVYWTSPSDRVTAPHRNG